MKSKKNILIVAAHPDDELLGCGGTVLKLKKVGYHVTSLILGEGATSRSNHQKSDVKKLRKDALKANQLIGIEKVHFADFTDNRFDSISLLKVIKLVEKYIARYSPEIIFTHHQHDLNIDHRITFQAVLTACRPVPGFKHPDIYSFEIPSSTDWNEIHQMNAFVPNVFVNIKDEIEKKMAALACYKTEMRPYPHSRSIEGIRILAQFRGIRVGLEYAEAFQLIRSLHLSIA